jgi:hypothetical protein
MGISCYTNPACATSMCTRLECHLSGNFAPQCQSRHSTYAGSPGPGAAQRCRHARGRGLEVPRTSARLQHPDSRTLHIHTCRQYGKQKRARKKGTRALIHVHRHHQARAGTPQPGLVATDAAGLCRPYIPYWAVCEALAKLMLTSGSKARRDSCHDRTVSVCLCWCCSHNGCPGMSSPGGGGGSPGGSGSPCRHRAHRTAPQLGHYTFTRLPVQRLTPAGVLLQS